jgi:hypothetical protein
VNQSTTLDVLREVIELKKINNGLMKATLIDDLIGDTYAKLYEEVGPQLATIVLPKAEPVAVPAPAPAPQPAPVKAMSLTNVINMDGASDQPGMNAFQTSAPPPPQPAEPAPKPRAKGVGRRELQRKAEACVTRPTPPANSIPIRSTPGPTQNQSAQVVAPTTRPSPPGGVALAGPSSTRQLSAGGAAGEASAPASVHEDADDESGSELSELDEEPEEPTPPGPIRSMFPGLMAKTAAEEGTVGGEESAEASAAPTPTPLPPTLPGEKEDDDGNVKMEE